jgi:hypothetical protein
MFATIFSWLKGAFEAVFTFFLSIWNALKDFSAWIVSIAIALIVIFTDVMTWIKDIIGRLVSAVLTMTGIVGTNPNIATSSDSKFFNFADNWLPLHEAFTFAEALIVILGAKLTITMVRFIKKTFWAA